MPICYLAIGSNLGDRRKNIKLAIKKLRQLKDTRVLKVSRIMQSKPVGGPPQKDFLNGALKMKTKLSALRLLKAVKQIERELGRRKTIKNGPRTIDLDILLYGYGSINRRELKVPHLRMFEREFVMKPLLEVI
jgi:2-amino-4-hydroxy-6-hydroxymethyldihydropteridine diphosphokinase